MGKRIGLEIRRFVHRYVLKDGSFYWHRFYYDVLPKWACNFSPPLGHYNYGYYFRHPLSYFTHIRDAARFFLQRGKRGYSDQDVWGLDGYLINWLPEAIVQFRKDLHGHPIGMTENRWHMTLMDIEQGFRAARRMIDMESIEAYNKDKVIFDKGMKLFHRHFFNLWD